MKKRWAMYTTMCIQLTNSLPIEYEYQIMQVALHQSDAGRPGTDQPQQRALTRVWSEPHLGPNKLAKEGGKRCDFKRVVISLRGEERRQKGYLDFFRSRRIVGLEDTSRTRSDQRLLTISRSSSS